MKKLLGIVVLGFLISISAFAESALPKCKGEDHTKWTNCYGKYEVPFISDHIQGAIQTFKGEFGSVPGKLDGAGTYYFSKDGIILAQYEGELADGRHTGFGIFTHKNALKPELPPLIIIEQLDKLDEGISSEGFAKIIYPEGDTYIGRTKKGDRHGKGLQTTKKSNLEVYAIFKNGKLIDNIPIEEIVKFEEDVLIYEANLEARKECKEIGINLASIEFKKCHEKFIKFYIKDLNEKRITKISNFENIKKKRQLYQYEDGELTECISYTSSGACAYRIPYEIKSKKYTNNKYDANELIKLGLILTGDNNNYLNSDPRLFYDSSSGKMLECAGKVTLGRCYSFKGYNINSYNFNTLFYNASNGTMQRCLNHVMGKCLKFRPQPIIPNRDQLFYDPKTNSMKTCLNSNMKGKCLAFGMSPSHRTQTQNTGSYIVDNPINPYMKRVPQSSSELITLGLNLVSGRCTLGLNC